MPGGAHTESIRSSATLVPGRLWPLMKGGRLSYQQERAVAGAGVIAGVKIVAGDQPRVPRKKSSSPELDQ